MKRFRCAPVVSGVVVTILVLTLLPGFGQEAADQAELASERSSASQPGQDPDDSLSPLDITIGRNVRVNRAQDLPRAGLLGRSETTVASDEDGERIVVGYNNAQGFCGEPFGRACVPGNPPGLSGYAFSTNGGRTFTDGSAPPILDHVYTRGDPWLDRGGKDGRTFFYANLAVDDRAIFPEGRRDQVNLGVSVHRGHFVGDSFIWHDVHVFNAPNAPQDFYDKEAIAVDKARRGLGVVSLTNFIETCEQAANGFGQIEVWRTANGGETWLGPVIVGPDLTDVTDPADPACGRRGTLQQSSAPAVGPDGEVFVAWQRGPRGGATSAQIVVARSLDGGATFDPPIVVANINSMRNDPPVGFNRDRINDHPRIAFVTEGRFKGRLFVAYYSAVSPVTNAPLTPFPCPTGTDPNIVCTTRGQRLTSSQVFLTYSDDLGLTWNAGVPVAPAPPAQGLKRWWPVVTAATDGTVDVVYYESQEGPDPLTSACPINFSNGYFGATGIRGRRGPAISLVTTFISTSQDAGLSFGPPVPVSTAVSNWCTSKWNVFPNFGDYIGSARAQEQVLATWADSRNGPVDTFFAPIGLEER